MKTYDAIVVGAGPAGARLPGAWPRRDSSVLLLERGDARAEEHVRRDVPPLSGASKSFSPVSGKRRPGSGMW